MTLVLIHILSLFPHLHFELMLDSIVSQLKIESSQYFSFHLKNLLPMFAIDPISQIRWIDLFIFHRHEETGLGGDDCLKLIVDYCTFG